MTGQKISINTAQNGLTLQEYLTTFCTDLANYKFEQRLVNTGLSITLENNFLFIRAHGFTLKSKIDHVVTTKDGMCGRIRFFKIDDDGKLADLCYTIQIERLGNMGHGEIVSHYDSRIRGDNHSEIEISLRNVTIGLINAIHKLLDEVPN